MKPPNQRDMQLTFLRSKSWALLKLMPPIPHGRGPDCLGEVGKAGYPM
ncbi:MAG: hypothetical protein PVG39_02155 [Desulfobacteraceae bacterium]